EIVLSGGGNTIYVSTTAAYIAYASYNYRQPKWDYYVDVVPLFTAEYSEKVEAIEREDIAQWRKENLKIQIAVEFLDTLNESQSNELYAAVYQREQNATGEQVGEKTIVHKFMLSDANGEIQYFGKGYVPGHLLNQFSLDEHGGYLRLATTIGEVHRERTENPATNNVYVLDASLNLTGKLEGLAPGERLYSSRFMGEKAYLVTFKKVDPLFVIDLSNPQKPQLLGKLKVPGYSDYLHPVDENHLIGLGKDAIPAEEGDFAWYQGVKLTLFDVSNVNNPIELSTYKIGDRGTNSYALDDHRAFLFNAANGLLVIPVTLAEINPSQYPEGVQPQSYGDYTFQGAYVFNVSLADGFTLRGRVSHVNEDELAKSGEYYYGGDGTNVERSAYIDNVLYTVSQKYIKANDLSTLEEKATVTLPFEQNYDGPYYIE
ncbi:MAG: beta-propeller domain-containing protein, partial [Candidatus Micrarchaeota archaeon]|nr:beta-propeller domain-containing protein [Candidatus Micrarchaeota archaeon]